ncbi:methylmalonyl-CoA mutase subunit beta [Aquimarina brevivitae]|uniref:Heterodimeric methylmalonyl-CoA mutase small subunit n=1 Tax=Aquimarina brevivitae TaxID=323412 RepID=A0A4Q7P0G6_9FLAO|nr:methylmalonyl-CoA mutase subunit beta [Aquimarina brevivitae]RZS93283.1 heterodimeric methylmalonyl-CoA mutase small subunit [Aquimarina brevivitae]
MTKSLFEEFNPVSTKEWKQKIQYDLKGADYNETLIYNSLENIAIKPFYTQDDIKESSDFTVGNAWKNSVKIEVTHAEEGNQKAKEAIDKGAESLYFLITDTAVDPAILCKELDTEVVLYITTDFLSVSFVQKLNDFAVQSNHTIYLLTDIINQLAKTGNWYTNLKEDHSTLDQIVSQSTGLKSVLSVDTTLYQNAGANSIQQLAYAIAQANEYLNHFNQNKNANLSQTSIVFQVAVGSNYFFEIAKIRALRNLWDSLIGAYKLSIDCHIIASPGLRNKSILDYNVNMLRSTTECMSAILGGADTVYNLPYDYIYNKENEFGTRISLNQLLILKEESYFDQVHNSASGSYYIESLTTTMAQEALEVFKNIEQGGGFLNQLKEGIVQRKIKESASKEQKLFDDQKVILTGVNAYQNDEELIPPLQKEIFIPKDNRKTLIEPIIPKRLAMEIEKKMLAKLKV